jgi:predicted DNA-binding transcriptional regulator AlpA
MHKTYSSIESIREWLRSHQRRLKAGDSIPTMVDIAQRAGTSRQTIYAFLNGERAEFGVPVQIRLSLVIHQLAAEPSYHYSKLSRVDFSGSTPRIRFGV